MGENGNVDSADDDGEWERSVCGINGGAATLEGWIEGRATIDAAENLRRWRGCENASFEDSSPMRSPNYEKEDTLIISLRRRKRDTHPPPISDQLLPIHLVQPSHPHELPLRNDQPRSQVAAEPAEEEGGTTIVVRKDVRERLRSSESNFAHILLWLERRRIAP